MVAPVEDGESGIDRLVSNGLLGHAQMNDRQKRGKVCLATLGKWASGR